MTLWRAILYKVLNNAKDIKEPDIKKRAKVSRCLLQKLLEALEIDYENNKVKVDLSKTDYVEFEDREKIGLKELDHKLIKTLIWW